MRLGMACDPALPACNYRAVMPAEAVRRRGHPVVVSPRNDGSLDANAFRDCDVVLVYRRSNPDTLAAAQRLAERGVAIVYDNDDDFLTVPDDHPVHGKITDETRRGLFEPSLRMARLATVMTVTTEAVAERYRDAGVERVEVVPNHVGFGGVAAPTPHEGIVVGWVAGWVHQVDADGLGLADALGRLVDKHADVRVECMGVDLGLPRRYRHDEMVPFDKLPDRIARWDIGLAPLLDIPFNRARSDIKVKEYAARGVPWLASPVGPYLGLGESEGGRLVEDDEWFKALDRLVRKRRERRRLSQAGMAWARTQTIQAAAARYERIFEQAIALAQAGGDRVAS